MKLHLLLTSSIAVGACSSGAASSPGGFDGSTTPEATVSEGGGGLDAQGTGDDSSMSSPEASVEPPWDASSWNEDAATPDGGDTWDGWVQGFVEKYCVVCHSSSDPTGRDFTMLANVQKNASIIRCGITPPSGTWDPSWMCNPSFPPKGQFPLSTSPVKPPPTDAERYRIIAWINAGTP
jgi:hypothetical protein